MTEPERAAAVAELEATGEALKQCLAGLSDIQARFRASEGNWSIEEIVEHVAIAEHGMYRFISEVHELSEDPHQDESTASMERTADRKMRPLSAPERAHPKGRFDCLGSALEQFVENRGRTIEFVKNCRDDLRLRLIQHPLGLLNGKDCLSILTHHPARHIEQINEVKADPAFPR